MSAQHKQQTVPCPGSADALEREAQRIFAELLVWCRTYDRPFAGFEKLLFRFLAILGRLLVRLFLAARHERLPLEPYLQDGVYRIGKRRAQRTLKTAYGKASYQRTQLIKRRGGAGFYPLDAELGLTRDGLTPWVMQLVARLATRMSFQASHLVCKAMLQWAPSTETIEQVVLGMGRQAATFMRQLPAPAEDGEVLIIETDGKCPPTATEAELAKRRGKRRHKSGCTCGCQRHRGQSKRAARGPKKRRKKGDKSKNGKEVSVVVMYTLKRGDDGKLHGPINKKVWASFAGRKAAALWARAEATKRGFPPDTSKTVQIIVDGAKGLKHQFEPLFPKAIFTLDVCHVVEKLWDLAHRFHREGSSELAAQVETWKRLLYTGRASELVERLRDLLQQASRHGPGSKVRRQKLEKLINYLETRLDMLHYQEWLEKDLVIASGQVEGAVRHVVGERFDCSGMRWTQGKAEPLLHLRCLELNGDWQGFITWFQERQHKRLRKRQRVKTLTDRPILLRKVA